MTDTTTKVREHYGAMGLTDRIKSALATLAPEGQTLTVVQLAPLDQFHTRGIPRDRRIGNRRRARVLEHLGDAAVRALIGGSPESANRTHQCSKAFQRVSSNYLLSFHALAHSLTQRETQLFYFQAIPHSLAQNSGGGGTFAIAISSWPDLANRPGGLSQRFPFQPSTFDRRSRPCRDCQPPPGHLFRGSRNTDHAPPRHLPNSLPVPKPCIGRTIGAGSSFRQSTRRSQFRGFRICGRRARWVSFLVVGSSSGRASPFFVPTNN
jgi:hypothetical protein